MYAENWFRNGIADHINVEQDSLTSKRPLTKNNDEILDCDDVDDVG